MEFKYFLNGKEFKVICDKQKILNQIKEELDGFEENYYQKYYTIGYEDGYLSKDEYINNINKIKQCLDVITTEEKAIEFIKNAQKKKNGTFCKNRIVFRQNCDNAVFITEWHNTWIYNTLSVKAISDLVLEIEYVRITDTPA